MADKRKNDPQDDEPISGMADERVRGVGDEDDEFDDAEDLDDEEDEEEGSTF